MASHENLSRYALDLGRAREAGIEVRVGGLFGLFGRDPFAREEVWSKLAAVRVEASAQRRSVREVQAEIPWHLAERAPAPVPEAIPGREARYLVPVERGRPQPCTRCEGRPGLMACSVCGGEGWVTRVERHGVSGARTIRAICGGCSGTQFIRCLTCEGTARTSRALCLEVTDRCESLRHVYAPQVSLSLQEHLGAFIEKNAPPPACLAISLEPQVGDPYRGTSAGYQIAGHRYEEVIPLVRSVLGGLGGEGDRVRYELALHAWPFLYAYHGHKEVALIADREGTIHCLRAG
jgi:hypothetical protein